MADERLLQAYFEDMYVQLAESDSDEAHKAWLETRGRLMKAFDPPTPVDEEQEITEDEFWEQALEDEFAADNPDQVSTKKGGQPPLSTQTGGHKPVRTPPKSVYEDDLKQVPQNLRVDDDGWTHQDVAPNLEEHQDIHIKGEDDVPEDA